LRALRTFPEVDIHLGQYQEGNKWRRLTDPPVGGSDSVQVVVTEEKGSDVNLATYLLLDAFRGDCEAAVIVSNDTDLFEPAKVARYELGIHVLFLCPVLPGMHGSNKLKSIAHIHRVVDPTLLASCQLPAEMRDGKGRIHKPPSW
jgi:hypothetical protein